MAGDWVSGKRTFGSLLCFSVLQSVPVSQPTGHGNQLQLIIKITRSFGSGFQRQNCKAKWKTDHNWEQMSKAEIYVRSYREHFGLWNYDSLFFLFVYFSAIMFIFFMWVELFLGLTFLHPDTIVKDFLFEIHMHIRDTYYACVGCCKGAMLTPGFFPFFSIVLSREQYRVPSRLVSRHSCRASYRVTVRGA
jgi:hypothetical protein